MQLETFLQICNQSANSSRLFDKNQRLIQHILHYGTSYERQDYHKKGEITALQEPSSAEDTDMEKTTPDTPVHLNSQTPRSNSLGNHTTGVSQTAVRGPIGPGQQLSQLGLGTRTGNGMQGPMAAGGRPEDDGFQNCAWMFSDSSLNDLYAVPFLDPTLGMNDFYMGTGG